jgi:hypothetical protein
VTSLPRNERQADTSAGTLAGCAARAFADHLTADGTKWVPKHFRQRKQAFHSNARFQQLLRQAQHSKTPGKRLQRLSTLSQALRWGLSPRQRPRLPYAVCICCVCILFIINRCPVVATLTSRLCRNKRACFGRQKREAINTMLENNPNRQTSVRSSCDLR